MIILKKTFSIIKTWRQSAGHSPRFESAQKAMADLSGIAVIPLKKLVKGNNYYLKMKVKIDKVHLPLHMDMSFCLFPSGILKHNGIDRIFPTDLSCA
jgi:hypothetical protein